MNSHVHRILIEGLKREGYEGLCSDECGCQVTDLAPCGGDPSKCSPGYLHPDGTVSPTRPTDSEYWRARCLGSEAALAQRGTELCQAEKSIEALRQQLDDLRTLHAGDGAKLEKAEAALKEARGIAAERLELICKHEEHIERLKQSVRARASDLGRHQKFEEAIRAARGLPGKKAMRAAVDAALADLEKGPFSRMVDSLNAALKEAFS